MADVFPTPLFRFMNQDIDIERATLEGGETLAGGTDTITTDGGGRVYADFSEGVAIDPPVVKAWRALLGILEEGVTPMVVPFCDHRHQPRTGANTVTYGDGTRHSDGTPFVDGDQYGEASAPAALRATSMTITSALSEPLTGGEWFTIVHPIKRERAYKVLKIDEDTATITFRPPLREAVTAGTELDFGNPRCLMKQDGKASAALAYRRQTVPAIRFVEAR